MAAPLSPLSAFQKPLNCSFIIFTFIHGAFATSTSSKGLPQRNLEVLIRDQMVNYLKSGPPVPPACIFVY